MLSGLARARRQLPLGARAEIPELLDSGSLPPAEVETNLADLARVNHFAGGLRASVAAIRTLAEPDAHVLDVGTGRADLPLACAACGWTVTGLDPNPAVLAVARRESAGEPRVSIVEGDGLDLPFEDGAFDVAHCSLLVHHLEPGAVVRLLREMRRVSRHGVVVNDLRRGVLPLLATASLVALLGRCRTTRHDGIASARSAYTLGELDELLATAGLAPRWRSPAWLPRVVTAAVPVGR
jgi:SAM-dependent methyltransferase